jgi:hypothetical protein
MHVGLELHVAPGCVQLRYPPHAAGYFVATEILGLIVLHLTLGRNPAFAPVWPLVAALALLAGVLSLGWVFWWQRVEFDRIHDVVRHGPRTIGPLRALVAVERAPGALPVLRLIFQDEGPKGGSDGQGGGGPNWGAARQGGTWSWSICGVSAEQADALGTQLAQTLGVPLK